MPRISIMTMAFDRLLDKTLDDATMLAKLDDMGYDGVEVPSSRLAGNPARTGLYAGYFARDRLKASCIDAISNLALADPARHAEAVAELRKAVELAAELSCPLVLSAGSHLSEGQTPEAGRARIAEGLRACLPAAQAKGIALAIEDFGVARTLQCAAKDCLAVLDAAPGAGFVFDTGNFYFAGEDPLDNFAELGPRTLHAHFKDWVKSETPEISDVSGTALGAGFIPNAELVRRFMALGTVPYFSIELGGAKDVFDGARRDLETLRNWIRTVA
ncbi:MAG: sugar phosphate isomerase/epimerase [Candidatus Hydrogenedentes bacterium]|nr:sugar phosphate isomerase/epimerase [Candidatus Hydrogenedentota bacterium]